MGLTTYDREHIQQILGGDGTWFTAELLRMVAHADSCTRRRLGRQFPDEVTLVEETLNLSVSDLDRELDYLFGKADMGNRARLRSALPDEYALAAAGRLTRRWEAPDANATD
jgi:hypothetical protein